MLAALLTGGGGFVMSWWKAIAGAFLAALVIWPIATAAGKFQGKAIAAAQCQMEALEAALEEARRQSAGREEVGRRQSETITVLQTERSALEAANADYEAKLTEFCGPDGGSGDGASCCLIDGDDRSSLRHNWGLD